jgi:TRAP-type C4-dicarboxylate transport system permease small subunit
LEEEMSRFVTAIFKVDITFHAIAGSVLAFMMIVTLLDVFMRNIGHPIVGSMEIISFCGSVVIGFAIPYTSWKKAHVYVDMLVDKLSPRSRMAMDGVTRCMGMALFLFISYNFVQYGLDLKRTGEVSASFRLPYYPVAYGLALSCFLQAVTLFTDLIRTVKGEGK